MDKMREEFEAWYSDFDGYGEAHKKELWNAWQASRAALRVELPGAWRLAEHEYKRQVEESLDSAGVSYE